MIDRDVRLQLNGKTYVLVPTLEALLRINRELTSPVDAARALQKLDFHAIAVVIAAGAGLTEKQMVTVQQEIFDAGIVNVAPLLGPFISALLDPSGGIEEDSGGGK